MNTFLDLLVLVVMALAAVSLVAVVLMFLVKNRKVKQICLYLVAVLGLYLAYVGLRISWPLYMEQCVVAVLAALASIGGVVLERTGKDRAKLFLTAQILVAASVFVGLLNAFIL